MDGSIRVKNQTKEIEVNDNGDSIRLQLGNPDFTNRLVTLMNRAHAASGELAEHTPGSPDEVEEFVRKSAEVCANISAELDAVFDDEVTRKVFGEQTPDFAALSDFFTQIAALINQFEAERRKESEKRIAKYTAKYTNGRKNS